MSDRETQFIEQVCAAIAKHREADRALIAQLTSALQGLFEHCAMVHKHWGEGDNSKQADAAQTAARAALAAADAHNNDGLTTKGE